MLDQVMAAVRAVAEEVVMPAYLKTVSQQKPDGSLFTEADLAAQKALLQRLQAIHPYAVVGEEMTEQQQIGQWLAGDEGVWCIDPIDGTTNFVNGLPFFAISAALMRHGRSVLGVVYDPVANEMFYAEKGKGAWLDDQKLPLKRHVPAFQGAMASVDLKRLGYKLAAQISSSPPYYSQRNYGACSLEWCYTAAGRFDLYLHGGQKLWDYAASCLILEEAGGRMCGFDQDDFWAEPLWQRSTIAALDPGLFLQWRDWVRAHK